MKALLVIDMQEFCIGKNHHSFFDYDAGLLHRVNEEIQKNQDAVVVYIRNLMKPDVINRFAPVQIYDNTPEAELAKDLLKVSEYVFDKYEADAFSNQELIGFLKEKSVTEVEIIGADGGGCAGLTAIGACKAGFHVVVNGKAIGTKFTKQEKKLHKRLKDMGAIIIQ